MNNHICSKPGCVATIKWSMLCGEHYWEMVAKATQQSSIDDLITAADEICEKHFGNAQFDKLRLALTPFLLVREATMREACSGLDELLDKLQEKKDEEITPPESQVHFTSEEFAAIFNDENSDSE